MKVNGLSKLNCLIVIGDEDPNDKRQIQNKLLINEVVNLQINDSYKTLINTARVEFTRQITVKSYVKNQFGEREAKLIGDTSSLFARGKRITIKLCYGIDENLKTMFDGYITSIVTGNPFVLECEDMGYVLKQTALAPIHTPASGVLLNEFIPQLLKGTGIELHPSSKEMKIRIGQVVYPQSCTAADILSRMNKWGIVCYMTMYNGAPHLSVGRTFFSVNSQESVMKQMPSTPYDVAFDENVAEDNLSVHKLDPDLMALEAIALYPDNSMYKATIRRDPKDRSKFQVVNESKISKRQLKNTLLDTDDASQNLTNQYGKKHTTIDLSAYNIRTYHEYNVDRETLLKHAQAKFGEISQTGIEGTLTLFGDFGLQAGCKVRLTDNFNPERNGVYVVSEVVTTFGVKGYRQKITIPYKLSD